MGSWFDVHDEDIPEGWTPEDKATARALTPYQRYLLAQGDRALARHWVDMARKSIEDARNPELAAAYAQMGSALAAIAAAEEVELPAGARQEHLSDVGGPQDAPSSEQRRGSWER